MHLSIYLSIYLFVCLSVCLSTYLQAWKRSNSARLPHFFELDNVKNKAILRDSSISALDNVKNETILRDFLNFWTWQHEKRTNSARLPQFSELRTSKTKHFCEISFKHGKLSADLTALCHCVVRFFHFTCLKYCACHGQVMPGHTERCTCHAKSSSPNWRSDAPKCNPSHEISARTS